VTRLALFDMDRTLLRTETASLYARFQRDEGLATQREVARALVWVGLYTFGLLDAAKVAEKALGGLRGTPEITLAHRCDDWFTRYVEVHITDRGREAVREHRARGDVCCIVTGATPYAARPLARRLGIEHVLASELEVDAEGLFTGRPVSPLNLGEGKVLRVGALAERLGARVSDAVFYTDSVSDLPLLSRVGEPVAVNPDPRLRRLAAQRGMRVERWT
jgi:HAD superfamily hydrolase (TIGR01490 family)